MAEDIKKNRSQRRKRRHHYFPAFHLNHFADTNGCVWVYDKKNRLNPNPKALKPKDIGLEVDLYSSDSEEGHPSDELETWLEREIDTPAAPVLRKIASRLPIPIAMEERTLFARYIMSRDLRTPKTRDFLLSDVQERAEQWLADWLSDPAKVRADILAHGGRDFTEEEIIALGNATRIEALPAFWHDFMVRHIVNGALPLLAKDWRLVHADRDEVFLTSDVGILKHLGDFNTLVPNMPGWWNNAKGWFMPLTPRYALMMAPGIPTKDALAQAVFVDRINKDLAAQAYDLVFASSEAALMRICKMAGL